MTGDERPSKTRNDRVSLSLSKSQVAFLHGLIGALLRSGDVRMRGELAGSTARIIGAAKLRADNAPVFHKPRTHCANGHEYTPENTLVRSGMTRRKCRTCRIEANERATAAKRRRLQDEAVEEFARQRSEETRRAS